MASIRYSPPTWSVPIWRCAVVRDVRGRVRDHLHDGCPEHIETADSEAGQMVNALYETDGLGHSDFCQRNRWRAFSLIRKAPTFLGSSPCFPESTALPERTR